MIWRCCPSAAVLHGSEVASMPTTLSRLCRPLIALAAIVVASLASEASACSTMASGKCGAVCGCCSQRASDAPSDRNVSAEHVALPVTLAACQTFPGGDCSCGSQEPVAPTPKPARGITEGRSEPGPSPVFVRL